MDRRRPVLLLIRGIALIALVAVLRAGDQSADVLGRHDERSDVVVRARSRRTHAMLRELRLEAGPPIERSSSYVELTASVDPRGSMRVKERTVEAGRVPILRAVGSAHD